jgi:hypothetical protein
MSYDLDINAYLEDVEDPVLKQVLQWDRDSEMSIPETAWREEMHEDYEFYAGRQDDPDALQELIGKHRPTSVYNEIFPKVNMLIGLAAQGRNDYIVTPVGVEDEALAELGSGVLKHYRKDVKFAQKEQKAFEHMIKSGRSLLYFSIDKSNPFEPKVRVTRVPGWRYRFDPDSVEYDRSDARYFILDKWVSEDTLRRWVGHNRFEEVKQTTTNLADMPSFFNEAKKLYRVSECWYFKEEWVYWFQNPLSGENEWLLPSEFKKFMAVLRQGVTAPNGEPFRWEEREDISYAKTVKKVYYYIIYCGHEKFEGGKSQYLIERFPAIEFGAYKDEDKNKFFGVITLSKDPQRGINAMRRQISHLLQTLPRGLLMAEVGAILNIEDFEKRANDPTFWLQIAKGQIDKVKVEQQPTIPNIYTVFDETHKQSMKDVTGIQDPLLGIQTTSREPGVTAKMRQETNIAVLYVLFSNYHDSREDANRLFFQLIQQYMTHEHLIRIAGPKGKYLMEVNTQLNPDVQGFNDITATRFDLELEESAETATMRLVVSQMLADINHNNPGTIPTDVIIEYSDLPYSTKERIRQHNEMLMESQQRSAEIEQSQKERELDIKQFEAETKRLQAMAAIATAKQAASESKETKQVSNKKEG